MINTQQLIVMMPLFKVNMPGNAQNFFNVIFTIASFDIVNLDPTINKALSLNATDPFNDNFGALGFQSIYLLNNLGSLLLAFIFNLLAVFILLVLDQFVARANWIANRAEKMRKELFFNGIVATMIESYSILSVCCLINLNFIRFGSYG